jgi:type I restriction enzyme S subunit
MEVKPGYKQTDVGVIPEDWEAKPLGQIASLEVGYAFRSAWFTKHDGVPLLRGENVGYGRPDWSEIRRLPHKQAPSYATYMLGPGDIVVGMDRTFTTSGTRVSVLDKSDCPCLLVQRVGKFIPSKCDARFLWTLLTSPRYQQALQAEQKGMDIPHLSRSEILHPSVPLPPTTAEQEAIAEALSDADAFIESLERLIAKKRDLKQGAMQELLTGKKRLPGFSREWQTRRLEQLAEIRSGGTPSTTQPHFWHGNISWCTPTDITALNGHKYLSDTSRKISYLGLQCSSAEMIPANSVVMTSRATIGECAINRIPVSTNQGFKNFVPFENTHVEFLYYLLLTKKQDFTSLCGGSTFLEMGKTQLAIFEMKLPTAKDEQSAIAEILSDMDAEIAALEEKLAKAKNIKQGMMKELLTGRVRLV